MSSETRKKFIRELMRFLPEKMNSPDIGGDVILRRYELDEIADKVGIDQQEAWQGFVLLKGTVWQGRLLEEGSSEDREERGYTAARLTRVSPGPDQ
jgi:hypothetical protein